MIELCLQWCVFVKQSYCVTVFLCIRFHTEVGGDLELCVCVCVCTHYTQETAVSRRLIITAQLKEVTMIYKLQRVQHNVVLY